MQLGNKFPHHQVKQLFYNNSLQDDVDLSATINRLRTTCQEAHITPIFSVSDHSDNAGELCGR
eukprot:747634-Hanusia_phi.AAC.1